MSDGVRVALADQKILIAGSTQGLGVGLALAC
jgi:hypothetical protein